MRTTITWANRSATHRLPRPSVAEGRGGRVRGRGETGKIEAQVAPVVEIVRVPSPERSTMAKIPIRNRSGKRRKGPSRKSRVLTIGIILDTRICNNMAVIQAEPDATCSPLSDARPRPAGQTRGIADGDVGCDHQPERQDRPPGQWPCRAFAGRCRPATPPRRSRFRHRWGDRPRSGHRGGTVGRAQGSARRRGWPVSTAPPVRSRSTRRNRSPAARCPAWPVTGPYAHRTWR